MKKGHNWEQTGMQKGSPVSYTQELEVEAWEQG